MRPLAICLVLLPVAAQATPYDGIYKQAANADCASVGAADGALQIEDNIFYGVQMECSMARPVDVVDMDATLYTLQCTGDDQNWTERVMLMKKAEDDGLIMIWNGYAFAYERCDANATEVAADDPVAEDSLTEEDPTEVAAD